MSRVERLLRVPALPYVVAAAPIAVAATRGLARGWLPMGDNAYFAVRAADVGTRHHPLVGAWSSGSSAVGVEVNNLGPLQLDLLALPVRLLGWAPGTLVGVALLNAAAACFVVAAGRALLGWRGGWLAALVVAAMAWTLGSELLIEPRQHHALVLPFLAVLAGVWCAAAGDQRFLPWTAALASLVAQTHLSFVLPLAVLALGVLAGVARTWRASRRDPVARRRLGFTALVTLAVLVIGWAQPVADQMWGGANLGDVAEAGQADQTSYGPAAGARALATVVGPPAGWLRPAFLEFEPAGGTVGGGTAALTLAVVAAALAAGGVVAARRGAGAVAALCATATLALVAGWAGAAVSPTSGAFGAVSGNFRFLWPVAALVWAAVLAAGCAALPRTARRPLPAAAAVVAVIAAVAAFPTSYQSPGPRADAPLMPVAEDLLDDLDVLEGAGPLLVRRGEVFFGEPYTYVVLAGLQERGVEFTFDTDTDVARFGDDRRTDGSEDAVLSIHTGPGALDPPPGTEVVAAAADEELGDRATVALWLGPR